MASQHAKIEKRPGWDWTVVFIDPEDNQLIPCTIFGVMDMKKVIEQAYDDAAMPEEAPIIAILRCDKDKEIQHILG